jgi:outer membrane protein OmpA-like peptidoglycan-associated protein
MRTIVTGIVVFVLWSALCTWYYLMYIKGAAGEEAIPTELPSSELAPAEPDDGSIVIEPAPAIESPGAFTVHHEFNRSEIITDVAFDRYVEKLSSYMNQVPEARIEVTGHTDNVGSDDYNNRLGLRRAESTKEILIRKGIPGQAISVSSRGESAPVASNGTDQGRAQNRRTEIRIIE